MCTLLYTDLLLIVYMCTFFEHMFTFLFTCIHICIRFICFNKTYILILLGELNSSLCKKIHFILFSGVRRLINTYTSICRAGYLVTSILLQLFSTNEKTISESRKFDCYLSQIHKNKRFQTHR